ncbi:MAG TPA: transglycosylase domain-containing protein [Actinomycetota bacterium]
MQAPPKRRSATPRTPSPARPRRPDGPRRRPRVIAPAIPILLALVIALGAVVVALVLLPLFGAAGLSVNAFRDRLDEAGVGRVRIPRFPERSVIYASDGSVLATVFLDENRRLVRLKNVAPVTRDAVLAIEDDSFYEHGALNFPSLIRAAVANLAAGDITQGGSTITQQLVKNVIIDDPSQTFARKFQEAALAIRLERIYTKDQILELYLNEVYFGNGAYGIGTASETYFSKPPGKLKLAEAALLAGVIRAPGQYDPVTNPEAALARRDLVLDRMADLGLADPAKVERAKRKPLGLAEDAGPPEQRVEPFFVYLIRNLILDNGSGEFDALGVTRKQRVHTLYQGGLGIHTTLDPAWQEYAQAAVEASPRIDPKAGPDASLVSVDATTGAIKAMLSGKDFERDQLDLVWRGARQVGSAFKPFTLVAAFQNGFPPGKVYSSASPQCGLEGWISESGCVSNAEGGSDRGFMDLWAATQGSVNVVFAQLALDVGPGEIVEAAHQMGITAELDAVPSITLGVEEVSTLDMASAYGTLANDGVHCDPYAVARIEAPKEEGGGYELLYRHKPRCEQAIDAEIAHLVTAMLRRVVDGGTGTAAAIGRPVAGKTGTAQDYTNVYFAGYTPQVATAVWVGFPEGHIPMNTYYGDSVFGGTVAAPIWHDFMVRAMQGYPIEGFEQPPSPESGRVPDVIGMRSAEAQSVLVEANFTPLVEKVDSFEPVNTVIAQAPGGGARLTLGGAVAISVSNGKGEPVVVPRVNGLAEAEAVKVLEKAGLVAAIERVRVDDPKLDGLVVAQTPIGDGSKVVDVGATVTIQVGELEGGDNGNGNGGGDGNGNGGDDDSPAATLRRD